MSYPAGWNWKSPITEEYSYIGFMLSVQLGILRHSSMPLSTARQRKFNQNRSRLQSSLPAPACTLTLTTKI